MNIQQLRQSLKMKWLGYYQQNRPWLVKMRVWGNYHGLRRPSSGFILATLSVLEPEFEQMLSFMMDLNNNPDDIVTALGLNFNPDEELRLTNLDEAAPIKEFAENKSLEEQPVRSLATANDIIPQSPATIQHPENITSDSPQAHQPLPAFAVATKVSLKSSHKSRQNKPISALALATTVPSNGKTVALAVELPNYGKLMPRSIVVSRQTAVKSHTKTAPSLIETTEVSTNGKSPQNLKTQPLTHTHARSLASWVDEFCQGRG
ncbi:hypothetical protein H6G80_12480 [Nostoc sp. FACHB-87]|uniref:DUF5331 domain-containing protein n=1 Tax=Nostocaceae TaxID=1162 RepID=UPI0016822448|nr:MULTISPECIES: DUF5331 domain-containing protein [Nostocaceae]MBD2454898.1 hypothetical protein [Nostoc sp. FACHB-87]MBD2474781.1 hypothetical protein [Anabaena sp. FACHB-83]